MKDDIKYLKHIQELIQNIENFMKGISKKSFLKDIEK